MTQSSSVLHSPSPTHIHLAAHSGFSILLNADFLGRLGIELLTFRLEDDRSTPSATVIVVLRSIVVLWSTLVLEY